MNLTLNNLALKNYEPRNKTEVDFLEIFLKVNITPFASKTLWYCSKSAP